MSFKPQHNRVAGQRQLGDIIYYRLEYNAREFAKGSCQGIDTEMFYPESNAIEQEDLRIIKRICNGCPVREMCLEWALCHEREGIWAGTRMHDRRVMRQKLRIGLSDPAFATKHLT